MTTKQSNLMRLNLPYGFILSEDESSVVFFNREYQPIKLFGSDIIPVKKETMQKLRQSWKSCIRPNRFLALDSDCYPAFPTSNYKGRILYGEMWFFYVGYDRPYLFGGRAHTKFLELLGQMFEAINPDAELYQYQYLL